MANFIMISVAALVFLWGIGCSIQTKQLKKEIEELRQLTIRLAEESDAKDAECEKQRNFVVRAQTRAGELLKELAQMTERAENAEQKLSRKNAKQK